MLDGTDQSHDGDHQEKDAAGHNAADDGQACDHAGSLASRGHSNQDEAHQDVQDVECRQGTLGEVEPAAHFSRRVGDAHDWSSMKKMTRPLIEQMSPLANEPRIDVDTRPVTTRQN